MSRPPAKKLMTALRRPTRGSPRRLAGGNPQLPKADGDKPVEVYLAALTGWQRDRCTQLDALIARTVPEATRAVRWNSPMYGIKGQGWFASLHVFTRAVKITFFRGTSLRPVPPGGGGKAARWVDIGEEDLDVKRLVGWIRQAAALPGWGKW